jgi:hypothetical protein
MGHQLRNLLYDYNAPILHHADFEREFFVGTDYSKTGLGAMLYQMKPEYTGDPAEATATDILIISLHSRSFNAAERNYSPTKGELLAIVDALRKWRHVLWGRRFRLFTDHRALTFMFTQRQTNAMLERWYETISEFDFEPIHLPGINHLLPDGLSRLLPDFLESQSRGATPHTLLWSDSLERDEWGVHPSLF